MRRLCTLRSAIPLLLIALAVATGAFIGRREHGRIHRLRGAIREILHGKVQAAAPPAFTVEVVETLTSGPADPVVRKDEITGRLIYARRSNGAHMDHFYHTGAKKADGRITAQYDEGTVFDPECQCRREKSELLHATTTYKLPADYFKIELEERTPTAESNCTLNAQGGQVYMEPTTVVGRENVLGYDAVVLEHSRSHYKFWVVPSLGCQIVGSENTAFDEKGRVLQVNRHKAVRITLGEPARELFTPVGDEVKPSERFRRLKVSLGEDPEKDLAARSVIWAERDRKYEEANRR